MEIRKALNVPKIILEKFNRTVEFDSKLYASSMIATLDKTSFILFDNKGIDLNEYLGKEMECLFEVTRGKIWYPNPKYKHPTAIPANYLWYQPSYSFFQRFINIQEYPESLDLKYSSEIAQLYESEAIPVFKDWGINGFGLEIYESKPVISTEFGVIILNEYEFEENIDAWKLDQPIFIEIHEAYLRGIRPYIPPEDIEEEVELTEAQKAEKARRAAQQERSRIAHEQMQERIRKRREAGEGPGFSVV